MTPQQTLVTWSLEIIGYVRNPEADALSPGGFIELMWPVEDEEERHVMVHEDGQVVTY